ncbi:MAG: hypothetical protein AABM33_01575 [Pseudomonadota bacterium]
MKINAWIGAHYAESGRVLLLMHSTYAMMVNGVQMPEYDYVPRWCEKHSEPDYEDRTFARQTGQTLALASLQNDCLRHCCFR